MHFAKLRLSGFKSFVDPVVLDIAPGLTGIVGPNGCGKSNLLEGLRWVMAEGSSRRLRGEDMDDVIFSGTRARPGRNVAEAVLTLDNAERGAPGPYNAFDELQVSRRIERGNGSVFRVNGKEARARDVQLLFADLASGTRSSALVGQGQVAELIRSKPVLRRHLLEEAAGIAGLQSRRREAELRLRAAEDNLERLADVVSTLEGQLAGLRRQARQGPALPAPRRAHAGGGMPLAAAPLARRGRGPRRGRGRHAGDRGPIGRGDPAGRPRDDGARRGRRGGRAPAPGRRGSRGQAQRAPCPARRPGGRGTPPGRAAPRAGRPPGAAGPRPGNASRPWRRTPAGRRRTSPPRTATLERQGHAQGSRMAEADAACGEAGERVAALDAAFARLAEQRAEAGARRRALEARILDLETGAAALERRRGEVADERARLDAALADREALAGALRDEEEARAALDTARRALRARRDRTRRGARGRGGGAPRLSGRRRRSRPAVRRARRPGGTGRGGPRHAGRRDGAGRRQAGPRRAGGRGRLRSGAGRRAGRCPGGAAGGRRTHGLGAPASL